MARKPGIEPFVRQVAAAVRSVAPIFHLPPRPTDAYVTAHAILSSGWFDGDLPRIHYNLFGIKATATWHGAVAILPTGECYTDAEIARAQAIPAGQAGSFIRFLDKPCAAGKRRVLIWDRFRSYPSPQAAITDHLRLVMELPRYQASAALLRQGSRDYMRQLGIDGWYTGNPDQVGPEWWSIASRSVPPILTAGEAIATAGWATVAVIFAAGVGVWAWRLR